MEFCVKVANIWRQLPVQRIRAAYRRPAHLLHPSCRRTPAWRSLRHPRTRSRSRHDLFDPLTLREGRPHPVECSLKTKLFLRDLFKAGGIHGRCRIGSNRGASPAILWSRGHLNKNLNHPAQIRIFQMDRKPPQNCAFCWQRLLSCNTRHCLNKRRRTHSLDKPDNEPEAKEMVNGRSGFGKFRPGNLLHLCWWSSHGSLHSYIQPGTGNDVWRSNPKDWQTPSS